MTGTCSLDFDDVSGAVDLSERGEKNSFDSWTSNDLVEAADADLRLSAAFEDDGINITVSSHHVENKETGRAFHTVLTVTLDWKATAQLRDFLNMISKWEGGCTKV